MGDNLRGMELLIETMGGDQPTILGEGDKDRDFRPLRTVLRGAALRLVEELVTEVSRTGVAAQVETGPAASMLGGPTFAVVPIKGVGSAATGLFAVQTGATIPEAEKRAAEVAVYEWELGLEQPPRLALDDRFLDLTGTALEFRDRVMFGPVDFFRPIVSIRDCLAMWEGLRRTAPGVTEAGRVIARTSTGNLRQLHWAQRCISLDAGVRMRGVLRDVTSSTSEAAMHLELVESTVIGGLLDLQDLYGCFGDITWPQMPLIIKWLTPYVPTIGHGVSTGQTPAIHPEDIPKVLEWIDQSRSGEPIVGIGRVRRGGGGYLRVKFHSKLINPAIYPNLGITVVFPSDVLVDDGSPVPESDSSVAVQDSASSD